MSEEDTDDELDFVGRRKEQSLLSKAIYGGGYAVRSPIVVVGPPGSGKTTLVRRFYNSRKAAESFPHRAWIAVDREFVEKDVLVEILKQTVPDFLQVVDDDVERLPLEKLRELVSSALRVRRYLIVFDDIKKAADWNRVRAAVVPEKFSESAVILTMSNKSEAEQITEPDGVYQVRLKNLSDQDSWALFLNKVGTRGGLIGRELKAIILEICQGLPLALIVLAGLLSAKEVKDWSTVLLRERDRATFGEGASRVIVSLAYRELPAELKTCLLYLGIFPRGYVIPTRRLLHLWAAEGFGDHHSDRMTPEEAAESYFIQLVQRNMIEVERWRLDGSPRTCCAPGILYDHVFQKAVEIGFYHPHRKHNDMKLDSSAQRIWRVAEYAEASDYDTDHLRSYICFNAKKGDMPTKEVGEFISKVTWKKNGFGLLKVLNLENIYKPVLPEDIGKLLLLKYLGLRWTFLDFIPNSVGNLPTLETLDVKYTNIISLPPSLWDSEKLRHLYLNGIHFDKSAQKKQLAQGSLSNLLTLWGLTIGKTVPSMEWLNRMKGLTRLGLTCHSRSLSEISGWISQCTSLRSLKLRSIDRFSRPSDLTLPDLSHHRQLSDLYLLGKLPEETNLQKLPQSLKILTLSLSKLKNDPMEILGQLSQLNILRLFGQSYLGKEMTSRPKGFPRLRVLKLWMLEELDKLIVGEGSMPALKEMEIRRCTKLRETDGLENLSTLKELILTNMPPNFIAKVGSNLRTKQSKATVTVNNWEFMPLPQE